VCHDENFLKFSIRENKKIVRGSKKIEPNLKGANFYIGETMAADFGKMSEME